MASPKTRQPGSTSMVRKLTTTAVMAAIATILMYIEFPIPIMPGFIKLDFSADFDYDGNDAKVNAVITINYTDVSGNAVPTPIEGCESFPFYDEVAAKQEEKEGLAIEAAFALFEDDNQTKVANYDELYAEACELYGKDMMDSIIELIVMFGSVK